MGENTRPAPLHCSRSHALTAHAEHVADELLHHGPVVVRESDHEQE